MQTGDYGSFRAGASVTVEDYVSGALGNYAQDYDVDGIVRDLREEINFRLPAGVTLSGNSLFGPIDRHGLRTVAVDLEKIMEDIELTPIIERHEYPVRPDEADDEAEEWPCKKCGKVISFGLFCFDCREAGHHIAWYDNLESSDDTII